MSTAPLAAGRAVDVALLVVSGVVCGFFVWRFVLHRRAVSIGVALLPLGWMAVAAEGLGVVGPEGGLVARALGVLLMLWLLHMLARLELGDWKSGR